MSIIVSRRAVVAGLSTWGLAGCSKAIAVVRFHAPVDVLAHVIEAIGAFARKNGYRDRADDGAILSHDLEGWRTKVTIAAIGPEQYEARFGYRGNLWATIAPPDLEYLANDFKDELLRVEGVQLLESRM